MSYTLVATLSHRSCEVTFTSSRAAMTAGMHFLLFGYSIRIETASQESNLTEG